MRFWTLLPAFIFFYGLTPTYAQDYLITWNNDTVYCQLPANPAGEGFRPKGQHKNGYKTLAVIFKNDSIRVINAGEIKGYYRSKHGKGLLCDGMFYSVKVPKTGRMATDAEGKLSGHDWYFMAVDLIGEYASLYKVLVIRKRLYTHYYVIKHTSEQHPQGAFMGTRKQIVAQLAEKGIEEPMKNFIEKNKSFTKMVIEYNRLKKAQEEKN